MIRPLPPLRFPSLVLGPLPHQRIGTLLGRPLSAGVVHCTAGAQKHAYDRHGPAFLRCHAYLAQVVSSPTYVGQGPHQRGGFELILEVPMDGLSILMALTLRPSNAGIYYVKSVYPVDFNKIDRRLRKGFLKRM